MLCGLPWCALACVGCCGVHVKCVTQSLLFDVMLVCVRVGVALCLLCSLVYCGAFGLCVCGTCVVVCWCVCVYVGVVGLWLAACG